MPVELGLDLGCKAVSRGRRVKANDSGVCLGRHRVDDTEVKMCSHHNG